MLPSPQNQIWSYEKGQKLTDTDQYGIEIGKKGFVLRKCNKTITLQLIYYKLVMNTSEENNEATNLGIID